MRTGKEPSVEGRSGAFSEEVLSIEALLNDLSDDCDEANDRLIGAFVCTILGDGGTV